MAILQKFAYHLSVTRLPLAAFKRGCTGLALALSLSQAWLGLVASAQTLLPAGSSSAILGDGFSLGAATDPRLTFDGEALWDLFKGERLKPQFEPLLQPFIQDGLAPPVILKPSQREYQDGVGWVFSHLQRRLSMAYLNTGEYSWGYLVSRALGVPAKQIYLGADNGARVATLLRQSDRLLDQLQGRLPSQVFVFYTGYDLCAPHTSLVTSKDQYKKALLEGLQYLVNNARVGSQGTTVNLVAYLPITQLLTNERLLAKKVRAFGEEMSCRELKKRQFQALASPNSSRHPEHLYLHTLIPPSPALYCPSLFSFPEEGLTAASLASSVADKGGHPQAQPLRSELKSSELNSEAFQRKAEADERLSLLASRVRQYRDVTRAVSQELSGWVKVRHPRKAITFRYLDQTESLQFSAEDVGPDCFHLSLAGQAKVAKAVLEAF